MVRRCVTLLCVTYYLARSYLMDKFPILKNAATLQKGPGDADSLPDVPVQT